MLKILFEENLNETFGIQFVSKKFWTWQILGKIFAENELTVKLKFLTENLSRILGRSEITRSNKQRKEIHKKKK